MSFKPRKASPSIPFFWLLLIVISSCTSENNSVTADNIVPDSIAIKVMENHEFSLDKIPDTLFSIKGKIEFFKLLK